MCTSKGQKLMSWIVCGIYLVLLIWLILFKFSTNFTELDHIRSINVVPFKGSIMVNKQLGLKEIIYNIVVFIPLGIYVSILKSEWSVIKKLVLCFCLSLFFEIVQYTFAIGASDITDIIGNTLGGFIGLGVFYLFKKFFKNRFITIINYMGIITETFAFVILGILIVANM